MKIILSIFWNFTEHRLRAGWRILLQGILFGLAGSLLMGLVRLIPAVSGSGVGQPLGNDPLVTFLQWTASLGACLLSLVLAAYFLDRRPLSDYGFHFSLAWWLDLLFGLCLGALLMTFIFLVEFLLGWVTVTHTWQAAGQSFGPAILAALYSFIGVGIQEEIFSRGYHLRNLAEGLNFSSFGKRLALLLGYLISSSIFGLLHLGNPNATAISTINIAMAGLLLGLGFILTGELALPIGLHITWNFFQGNVYGFPVSGMDTHTTFLTIQQSGPSLWTGAEFGPEAGLIGLLAMLIGAGLIGLWVRWSRAGLAVQDRLAVYTRDETGTSAAADMPPTENTHTS